MTFSIHPEAERDTGEAMDFHADQTGALVVGRFLDEIERAFVYRSAANGIRILIVRHQHRKPGFGHGRR